MKWFILDSETNILNRGENAVGNQTGHPASEHNHIVSLGEQFREAGELKYNELYDADGVAQVPRFLELAQTGVDVLLVMHNASFDFRYLLKEFPEQMDKALPFLYVWDTMQVEFLLEGGDKIMPSLDWCAEQRGLPLKDDKIKQYWKNGIDTSLIPEAELLEYQWQDVDNTRQIFLDQWNAVSQSPKLLELVRIKMDDKLLTTFMEHYGMHFNLETAAELLAKVDAQAKEVYNVIMEASKEVFAEDFTFNPASPDQVSTFIYGGEYKVERLMPILDEDGNVTKYKSGPRKGEEKFKKVQCVLHTPGLKVSTKGVPEAKGGWSTSDDHLSKLEHPVAKALLEYRGLKKDSETYLRGYSSLVWPDNTIKPNQNHETVVTGRLSCSAPNLANISKAED